MYLSGPPNFHAREMAFTRRLSHRWQASGTYTLSVYWDGTTAPAPSIKLAQDLGEEYGLATTDRRVVFNGIWDVGYRFQLTGLWRDPPCLAGDQIAIAPLSATGGSGRDAYRRVHHCRDTDLGNDTFWYGAMISIP